MAQHTYFNLDGVDSEEKTILDHILQINRHALQFAPLQRAQGSG